MSRFVAMHCSDEADELQKRHPNAFLLLCQIARRAKWRDCSITKLKAGEAFIGDWESAGLSSEKAYRHAKKILLDAGLAAFRGANKGTVATLVDKRIFSVSADDKGEPEDRQGADEGRAKGGRGATNHTDTQIHGHTDTSSAPNGTSSDSKPIDIGWDREIGFTGISDNDRSRWKTAYPAVDLDRQIAAASEWLRSNPAKRKKDFRRFLTGWLARAQERGGDIPSIKPASPRAHTSQNVSL